MSRIVSRIVSAFAVVAISGLGLGCIAVIQQDEVGVRNKWGKYDAEPIRAGVEFYNPISTDIERVKVRTRNLEVKAQLPSKEGLTIETDVSILYSVRPEAAAAVLGTIGRDYENTMILSVFRSSAADVSARFFAKDMHSGERARIEGEIKKRMSSIVSARGFTVEAVLLKSISLPPGLSRSIELKLQAEQDAQRMVFEVDRERQQAEQRKVQAEGVRDAQHIVSQGLTEAVLRFEAIKAFRELAGSANAKIIISDGKTPVLLPAATP